MTTKRTVKRLGQFRVGSFGVYPGRPCRGDEVITLWAVEPDHSRHVAECAPALPTGLFLAPSRASARQLADELD